MRQMNRCLSRCLRRSLGNIETHYPLYQLDTASTPYANTPLAVVAAPPIELQPHAIARPSSLEQILASVRHPAPGIVLQLQRALLVFGLPCWLARNPQVHAIAAGDFDRAVGVGAIPVADETGAIGDIDVPLPGGVLGQGKAVGCYN